MQSTPATTSGSLITSHRPKTLKQIVGQSHVVKPLSRIIAEGRTHTFVFTGPSGTGKTTMARICCEMIGAAADLKEIDAASFTGIDDWKTIREGIQYHPMGRGVDGAKRRRAVIVDECHMLSKNAWASLLKDTEDVPGHLYWFFCTSEASKVPAAIKGRSACMDLRAVDPHELAGLLEDICEKEGYDTPTGILDLIASESGGSPRQAIAYLDVARECTSKAEASVLMQTHASSGVVIEIAKGLVYGNLTWDKACAVATSLHGKESAETIRRITVAYVSKALLNSKKSKAPDLLAVMEAFSAPFHSEAKAAEILLPVGKLLL